MARLPFLPGKAPERPTFPTAADLPDLPPDVAEQALNVLRGMVLIDVATVYTSAGSQDTLWQVWLEITRRRVTLQEWAVEWLNQQVKRQARCTPLPLTEPRFTVGQTVSWRDGRCTIRVDGVSTWSEQYRTRFYNGPILSGENAGSYAMSVPEEQLEREIA